MTEQRYKTKCCRVYDNGLFLEVARRLARDFGKVQYYCPWQSAFPTSNRMEIGEGIAEFEKIPHFWDGIDEVDLFVFPDTYAPSEQEHLRALGKRVWGGGWGEKLELDRVWSKKFCQSLGIPVPPYRVIRGTKELREYLSENENKWVKISASRGDTETFRAESYDLVETKLDELEHLLGARKELTDFIVEDHVEGVEIGYDGYCIDGQYPAISMFGIEVKAKCYVGKIVPYGSLPPQVRLVNENLREFFRAVGYRAFFSTEIRVAQNGIGYLNDPCCRMPAPPGEIYQEIFTNFSDIIWNGAEGKCIDPEWNFTWGVSFGCYSQFAIRNQQSIKFPPELRDNIKFRYLRVIDGRYYVLPQEDRENTLAGVIALGNTLEEAEENLKEYMKYIKAFEIEYYTDSLDEAREEIQKLESLGISFM